MLKKDSKSYQIWFLEQLIFWQGLPESKFFSSSPKAMSDILERVDKPGAELGWV